MQTQQNLADSYNLNDWNISTNPSAGQSQTDLLHASETSHTSSEQTLSSTLTTLSSPDFGDDILFPSKLPVNTTAEEVSKAKISSQMGIGSISGRSSSSAGASSAETGHKVCKRQRNTEAARRYRQRKVDRVSDLEEALLAMTKERDELKLKLARSEAEADVLRGMVSRR